MKETPGMFLLLGDIADNSTAPRTICHPSRHHGVVAASLAIGTVGSSYTYKNNPGHFHCQLVRIYTCTYTWEPAAHCKKTESGDVMTVDGLRVSVEQGPHFQTP